MCSDLNTVCANLNTSPFIHVKKIASIVGQIISLAQLWERHPNYD